jgi:hypothetical protein
MDFVSDELADGRRFRTLTVKGGTLSDIDDLLKTIAELGCLDPFSTLG